MGKLIARAGSVLGPALFEILLLLGPPEGFPTSAWRALAVLAWMATWWILQPIPLAATALLPLVLFPLLGVLDVDEAAAPYASSPVFLLLGGLLLARAVEKSGLHLRVARGVLRLSRGSMGATLAGIVLATAALGMWMSISATALLMMPLALSVAGPLLRQPTKGQTALVLAVPYAAAIAAMATLVATPPIALLAATLERDHGVEVGFARWVLVGGTVALLGLAFSWMLLRASARTAHLPVEGALDPVASPMRAQERRAAALVLGVIALWIAGPLVRLDETVVAMAGGVAAFLLPSGEGRGARLLEASDIPQLPWHILLLVGGGLSLGYAATTSGLAGEVVGALASLAAWPPLLALLALAAGTIAISEMSSNTATAAALLPLAEPLAEALQLPGVTVATTLALAACAGFAMPVGTPPNALAFGTGMVPLRRMILLGVALDAFMAVAAVLGGLLAARVL